MSLEAEVLERIAEACEGLVEELRIINRLVGARICDTCNECTGGKQLGTCLICGLFTEVNTQSPVDP